MQTATRVFSARRIVTLNHSLPVATHVAVRDGRILGVGGTDMLDAFGPATLDDRFAGDVIVPGFVEGHGHAADGLVWRNAYVGYFPRTAPDGTPHPGFRSIAEVVAHLRTIEAAITDPDQPLIAWGFDPIYFGGPRMTCADLDAVSARRLVVVAHVSGHILNVNSAVLHRAGFHRRQQHRGPGAGRRRRADRRIAGAGGDGARQPGDRRRGPAAGAGCARAARLRRHRATRRRHHGNRSRQCPVRRHRRRVVRRHRG